MDKIIRIIVENLTSVIMIYIIVTTMVLQPLKKTAKVGLAVFLSALKLISALTDMRQVSTVPMLCGVLFIVAFSCRQKILNMICVLLGYISSVAVNYGMQWITEAFFGLGYYEKDDNLFYIIFYLCFLVFVALVTKGIHFILKYRIQLDQLQKTGPVFALLLIQMTGCTAIFVFNIIAGDMLGYGSDLIQYNAIMLVGYIIVTYAVFGGMIQALKKLDKVQRLMENYGNTEEYEKENLQKFEEMRQFRHNYLNILRGMEGYLEGQDLEGLKEYYTGILEPIRAELLQIDFRIEQLNRIKPTGLRSLMRCKVLEAMKADIDVILNIPQEVDQLEVEQYDLLSIVGVFLDNAIEAAMMAEFKEIMIIAEDKGENWTIIIRNTYLNENMEPEKLGEAGYSTKGSERGIGLYSVNRILKKYKNLINIRSIQPPYFIQSLEIEKKGENK